MPAGEQADSALRDAQTRRSLAAYTGQAFAALVVGIGSLCLGIGVLMDANGDAKPGVPSFVLLVVMLVGLFGTPFGLLFLLNCARVAWVLAHHPWTAVPSTYEMVGSNAFGNGQPTVTLGSETSKHTLTLLAFKWRWRRFAQSELLFAGRPSRAGVIATTDRRAIVWAGRSLVTWIEMRWLSKG